MCQCLRCPRVIWRLALAVSSVWFASAKVMIGGSGFGGGGLVSRAC